MPLRWFGSSTGWPGCQSRPPLTSACSLPAFVGILSLAMYPAARFQAYREAALLSPLVAPPEFPYRLPQDVPAEMVAFRESIAARPAYRWVLEMYRRHRGRSAAVDAA